MWLTSSIAFWSSAGLVGYTYLGYPLAAHLLSRVRPREVRPGPIEPTVSVVLAAFNEQQHIGRKLENLLNLDYPASKLELIVVSDGSTDDTDAIVAGYADRGVVLERMQRRSGKAEAINRAVQRARGEVVVFCDTRQRIDRGALRAIVPLFADPQVGAVSGELVMEGKRGPGFYWTYEKFIRTAESKLDSLVGATGALYAIRRHLFRDLPRQCLLDDVYTPMQVVLQGYRVLLQPEARCYDREASLRGEFSRKARTLAGNFQLLRQLPGVLNPLRNRLLFQFVSHKLLRLACPFALGTLLASNVALVASGAPGWPLYAATLAGQLAAYSLAARGALRGEQAGTLARVSHTFVVLNAAAVEGLRRYLKGDFAWSSERSQSEAELATQ
jgi:cellulose synthase/poly-beta-1,6-N-acetylglucosamine synthase-like glycosyltransferase